MRAAVAGFIDIYYWCGIVEPKEYKGGVRLEMAMLCDFGRGQVGTNETTGIITASDGFKEGEPR